jgi:large subunit ribosomal protein L25
MTTLDVTERKVSENLGQLRKKGLMPAVFYGKKTASTPVTLVQKDFIKVWKTAGESGVVTLKGAKQSVDALITAVDIDPVSDIVRHADFYVFEKGKKIEVSVPLDFVGVAPAVKDLGGSLVKVLHEIKISAAPEHLPHDIKVDISKLETFESQILASGIALPTGVTLVEDPEEVVASAAAPKEEEVEEAAPVDLSAIEVEKKGKKEEEGAESETPAKPAA